MVGPEVALAFVVGIPAAFLAGAAFGWWLQQR